MKVGAQVPTEDPQRLEIQPEVLSGRLIGVVRPLRREKGAVPWPPAPPDGPLPAA